MAARVGIAWPVVAALLVLGLGSSRLQAAPIHQDHTFTIRAQAGQIHFAVALPKLYDRTLADKLESGTTRLLLYRYQLIDSDGDLVTEFLQRVSVKYESLAQVPYYEVRRGSTLMVLKTKAALLAQLLHFPPKMKGLIAFPSSLLGSVTAGRYRLRIVIWLDPFTAEDLARLNKLFQPLGQFNILKMKLFDNAKFRPRREYYMRSQVFTFAGNEMGRFELKIIAIVLVVALGSLVAATLLVKRVIRDSLSMGINKTTLESLRFAIDTAQSYKQTRRQSFTLAQAYLSGNQRLLELIATSDKKRVGEFLRTFIDKYDFIRSIAISTGPANKDNTAQFVPFVQVTAQNGPALETQRTFTYTKELRGAGRPQVRFTVVFLFPKAFTRTLAQTIRWEQTYKTIYDSVYTREKLFSERYSTAFILIYAAILLLIAVLAVFTTRKVTSRIAALADGTRQVTAGNLEIRLTSTQDDELGDLMTAFNQMVVELQMNRQRISYLSKVSGWQGIARRLAHEIKNPLTPILLAVQQVQSKYAGDDARFKKLLGDSLEIVSEEIAGLRRLVNEFSEFAKLPEVTLADGEAFAFIDDFLQRHNHFDDQASLHWRRPSQPEQAPLRFDKLLLQRVLYNLVENAIQAQRGADRPEVILSAAVDPDGASLVIRVADRGPGIPDDEKSKIFEPYFTTKAEGTGLGLAISKKIVLEHNGQLAVEDNPAGGTVMVVRLPLVASGSGPVS